MTDHEDIKAEARAEGVQEFRRREMDGFVFPNASNAFVQGYIAGAPRQAPAAVLREFGDKFDGSTLRYSGSDVKGYAYSAAEHLDVKPAAPATREAVADLIDDEIQSERRFDIGALADALLTRFDITEKTTQEGSS